MAITTTQCRDRGASASIGRHDTPSQKKGGIRGFPPEQGPASDLPDRRPGRQPRHGIIAAAKQALIGHDAAAVLALVSRGSLDRAERIRAAAMAGAAPAPGTGPAEKLAILGLRRTVPAAEIGRRDLPALVQAALGRDWLAPPVLRGASLQHIQVKGDHATATVIASGKAVPLPASFLRENGTWHVDLVPLLEMSDALMRLTAGLQHESDDALVATILDRSRVRPAP